MSEQKKVVEQKPAEAKKTNSSFSLKKKTIGDERKDVLDNKFGTSSKAEGWLFLQDDVIKRRTEFGTLNLVDASLINSETRIKEVLGKLNSKQAKQAGHKVYFTSQEDADAFEEVYESYGFTKNQFGGLLPSLRVKK